MPASRWRPAVLGVGLVGVVLPLVALGVQGWFARYAADDYCTASQVVSMGLLQAQSILYVSWSGRFAATLLITLVELFGPVAVRVLPILTIFVWLGVATWSARRLGCAAGYRPGWLASALAATVLLYVTLLTTADLPQVLYWQTGLLTYVAPLVLFTFLVGWIALLVDRSGPSTPIRLGLCCVAAFLAGGTNETFAAAQVTMLVWGIALAVLFAGGAVRRRLAIAMGVSLLGALLGLAVVAAAPGNAVRAQTTITLPISDVLLRSVDFTRGWLRLTFARPHVIELALLIGVAAVLGALSARPSRAGGPRWGLGLLLVLGTGLVLLACMVPVYYALNADPPGRALLEPQYLLICMVAILAWYIGSYLAGLASVGARAAEVLQWSAAAGLVVLLVLGPLLSTIRIVGQLGPDRAYAASWDALDAEIRADRAQGQQDVTVGRLDPTGTVHNLDFFGSDRQDWLNECVARYYAVNSVAST